MGIRVGISGFLRNLDELGLVVTQRASDELSEFAEALPDDEGATLSKEQSARLMVIMKHLRRTLDAEIKGFEAYIVTPKRIDVSKLLDDTPSLLAPGVHSKLPEIAQFDLAEAGKCIAFERPTAAAFHILRGTEAVLVAFYEAIVRQKRVKRMWGPMVSDLKKRRKAKPYEVLLNNLDNIRLSFRNPTQHPELIYDIHEVQDLLALCFDAINRMARALP
ncbi:MAG: hypothetical protein IIA72_05635 [Proteobacteria bacterium]|nr:hypothetical protein [Pseudomonadota bacterium]